MMFLAWTAMSFGTNLLTFYTKHLPGEVYSNSMVIGLASLSFIMAGTLGAKYETRHILCASYILAFVGATSMVMVIIRCEGDGNTGWMCENLAILVFITRCGLNMANCFIFVIHTELFPTYFLATSYGLCNFVGRGLTLTAPILAESSNRYIPLSGLITATFLGVVGCALIKNIDSETLDEEKQTTDDDDDSHNRFDQLINTSIVQ